jgi:hypothetical protein
MNNNPVESHKRNEGRKVIQMKTLAYISFAILMSTSVTSARTIHINGGTDSELAIFLTIVGTIVLTVVATFVVRTLRKRS